MSKKTNILIASTIMGLSTHAATVQDYQNISIQYAGSYFEYLEFKQTAPSKIASVKASIAKTQPVFNTIKAEYDREAALYNRLNNELISIPGRITALQTKKQNSIDAIPALKQAAKVKGLFSSSENPNQELSQKKINDLKQIIVAKQSQISTLEAKIDEIENRPEWQNLSFERSSSLSELNAKKNRRLNKESEVNRLSSRINQLENEIRNIQTTLFQLDDRKDFIDSHLPTLAAQSSQLSVELNNKNNEVFSVEESLSEVNRRISVMESNRRQLERDLENSRRDLRSARSELASINQVLNNVPQLENELSNLEGRISTGRRNLQNKENEKSGKETRLSTLNSQLNNKKDEVRRLNRQIRELENGTGDIPAQIARIERQIQEKQQLASTLPNLRSEKQRLEAEIAALENQTPTPSADEVRVLELANKILNGNITKVERAEFMRLAVTLYGRLERNPKKFAQKIVDGDVPSVSSGSDGDSNQLKRKKRRLNNIVNNLIPEAQAAKQEIPGLQAELQALQSGSSDVAAELARLIAQRDAAQAEVRSLENRINPLQREIDTLTGEINRIKGNLAQAIKRKNEIETKLADIPELRRKKQRLENRRIPNINQAIADLEQQIRRNNGALRVATSRRDNLNGELNVLRRQRDRLDSEFRSLNNQISSLGSELQDIANQSASLRRQMRLSEGELTTKRSDLFSAESELSSLNAQIPGLQAKYNSAQSAYDSYYASNQGPHQNNINRLSSEISDHNSDIRAFEKLIDELNENEQIIADSTTQIASLEARQIELAPQVEAQSVVYDEVNERFKVAETAYNNDLIKLNRLKRDWETISREARNLEAQTENTFRSIR